MFWAYFWALTLKSMGNLVCLSFTVTTMVESKLRSWGVCLIFCPFWALIFSFCNPVLWYCWVFYWYFHLSSYCSLLHWSILRVTGLKCLKRKGVAEYEAGIWNGFSLFPGFWLYNSCWVNSILWFQIDVLKYHSILLDDPSKQVVPKQVSSKFLWAEFLLNDFFKVY